MLSRADDVESVGLAVSGVADYKNFFDQAGMNQSGGIGAGNMAGGSGNEGKSLEDMFYQKEMELSKLVFTQQFTHAVIYAWVKLREQVRYDVGIRLYKNANVPQEIRNITWIAECIAQNQKDRIGNYITVF